MDNKPIAKSTDALRDALKLVGEHLHELTTAEDLHELEKKDIRELNHLYQYLRNELDILCREEEQQELHRLLAATITQRWLQAAEAAEETPTITLATPTDSPTDSPTISEYLGTSEG